MEVGREGMEGGALTLDTLVLQMKNLNGYISDISNI